MIDKVKENKGEMKEERDCCNCDKHCCHHHGHGNPGGGAVYGLGLIGAAIYFIGQATTFQMGVIGFLKALVWPAFLVYDFLKFFAH